MSQWPVCQLKRKTFGRIFVASPEHVQIVKDIIEEVDPFEFEYLRKDVIAVFAEDKRLVYLHKFEIDANALAKACMEKGVWIWIVDGAKDSD